MKKIFSAKIIHYLILIISFGFLFILGPRIVIDQFFGQNPPIASANANITFGNGYFINLSGGGADLNGNINNYNDEALCSTSQGFCQATNRNTNQDYANGRVERYVCNGKTLNCDGAHNSGLISGPTVGKKLFIDGSVSCGKTVQLDVFDGNSLHGFMTWYSGDCPAPSSSSTSCSEQPSQYPQCGGTCNGITYPSDHTVMVTKNVNNSCQVSFQCQDLGKLAGQCNNPGSPTPEMVTTCNGRHIDRATLESELRGANYPGPWGDLQTELDAFNRAACPSSPPQTVTTCNNRQITKDELESELRGANYPGPWGDINVELAAFNRAACPSSSPSQSPSQSPISSPKQHRHQAPQQQTQSQQQSQIINIFTSMFQPSQQQSASPSETPTPTPSNTPQPSSSSNVSVEQKQSQSQTQTGGQNQQQTQSQSQSVNQPQVVSSTQSSNVEELPRTGVPLFGLASLGFAPIAWRLRKNKNHEEKLSANSQWEKRQMQK